MKIRNYLLYIFAALMLSLLVLPDIAYAYCPLGPDVTKDLYGVLKIFQIAAPVFCIAFSTLDVVKTVAKGDAEAEMKKVAQKFGKRLIYTVLLFFLPVLVDQGMQMADVWDAHGTCDLTAPDSNGTEGEEEGSKGSGGSGAGKNTTKPTTTKNTCAQYDATICDTQSGCYWDGVKNVCSMKSGSGTTKATTSKATTTRDKCAQYDATICDLQSGCYWDGMNNGCKSK